MVQIPCDAYGLGNAGGKNAGIIWIWVNAISATTTANPIHSVSLRITPIHRNSRRTVLLKLDADGPGWSDAQAANAFDCSARTVFSIRQRFVEAGLDAALERKQREHPPRERILDGDGEAQLVRLACSAPPEGQARWILALLANNLVELKVVETISSQTVMRTLKKTF